MPVSILMPALSPTMTEGNVAKWLKKEGDKIKSGDIIAEVETDKATMEVEAIDEGTLAKIIHEDGAENISVNSLIGVIALDGDQEKDVDIFLKKNNLKASEKGDNDINNVQKKDDNVITEDNVRNLNNIKSDVDVVEKEEPEVKVNNNVDYLNLSISPLARRIAKIKNLDLSQIKGSGPRGRIVKKDLDVFIDRNVSNIDGDNIKDQNNQNFTKIPLTNIRKTIASKLQSSKQNVPHFYLKSKVYVEKLIEARNLINTANAESNVDIKVSFNDIIIKTVACALLKVPEMNVTWNNDSIIQYKLADIGVAVATELGLFTPVIRSACIKSISDISAEMKGFVNKARNNKLMPEEYSGGSFSISNLGMYKVNEFSAIINPPQSGILAVGEIFEEPKVIDNSLTSCKMINLVLSVDHRVVDGAIAANFLNSIKFFIENPLGMLV